VLEEIRSKVVQEIEQTKNLTEKFRFWQYFKEEKTTDQLTIIASSSHSPITVNNTIGDISSISGTITPRPAIDHIILKDFEIGDRFHRILGDTVNRIKKKIINGLNTADKEMQINSSFPRRP